MQESFDEIMLSPDSLKTADDHYFFIIVDKIIKKALQKLCLGQLCRTRNDHEGIKFLGLVINRVAKLQILVINLVRVLGSGPHT